ncbi:MAG: Crp/Fnr family transcriptional regulator [Myxococcales bacterium]|nr:Crp/Fnr family transcriptional regulator [Myxococcales bacterium]
MRLTPNQVVDAMKQCALFADQDSDALADLAAAGSPRSWEGNRLMFAQGEPMGGVLFLTAGLVRVTLDRHVLDLARGPSVPVLAAALERGPSPVGVSALRGCEGIVLDRDAFLSFVDARKELRTRLVEQLADESNARLTAIQHLVGGSVEQRMVAVLDRLAERHGSPLDEGRYVSLPLRRADIAMMVCATTETASRTLAAFERRGWLRTNRAGLWWAGARPEEVRQLRTRSDRPATSG